MNECVSERRRETERQREGERDRETERQRVRRPQHQNKSIFVHDWNHIFVLLFLSPSLTHLLSLSLVHIFHSLTRSPSRSTSTSFGVFFFFKPLTQCLEKFPGRASVNIVGTCVAQLKLLNAQMFVSRILSLFSLYLSVLFHFVSEHPLMSVQSLEAVRVASSPVGVLAEQ